ncbi:MAG: glycerophosphodiester phosphodiesterase [Dehalococcoidia bacterium]|nr:glycerophosphodiester phosphodiesterase [Dehalococcoidia bacterium]
MPPPRQSTPDIVSHRAHGGSYPENTLAGIEASIRDGARAVEIDVRRTQDGALVLMHDETLARTTGDPRRLADVTLADLDALRVTRVATGAETHHPPERIPTLEDALRLVDGRAAVVLDFVSPEIAQACVALVNGLGVAPWTWWTAHPPRLARTLLEDAPGSRSFLGWTPGDGIAHAPAEACDLASRHGLAGLMADHRYVDASIVRYAHGLGLSVYCWTVNDPKRMAEIARMGVDGITTDYPMLLAEVLQALA